MSKIEIVAYSFIDYWRIIEKLSVGKDEMLFYRGVDNESFKFLPGVIFDKATQENVAYNDIILEFPEEFSDRKHLSNLVKMQHYGLPTRLLDFSINPLISLFFAIEQRPNLNGVVSVIRVKKKDILHHNSDKALMLSCLPLFNDLEQKEIRSFCESHPGEISDNDIANSKIMKRFLHEIRGEYPAFETAIIGTDLLDSFFVMPNKDNERMKIQDGAFVLFGLDLDKGKRLIEKQEIARIIIDKNAKGIIRESLAKMGIINSSVYPGLERTALYLRNRKLGWKSLEE